MTYIQQREALVPLTFPPTELELLIDKWLFFNTVGSLKGHILTKYVPQKCRKIYAQIPPHVGFVPPHLSPPMGGDKSPPMAKSLWETLQGGWGEGQGQE